MATPGQSTLYKPEYCELAGNDCLLDATNEVLGDFFGVTRRTLQNWIATRPDFAKAVRRGRAVNDARWREHVVCRRWSGGASLGRDAKNDGRKGRKGRKPMAPVRRVGFVNNFNHRDGPVSADGRGRKVPESAGKSLRELCARNCPLFSCLTQGVQSRQIGCANCGNPCQVPPVRLHRKLKVVRKGRKGRKPLRLLSPKSQFRGVLHIACGNCENWLPQFGGSIGSGPPAEGPGAFRVAAAMRHF